jgi:hypothetical protein
MRFFHIFLTTATLTQAVSAVPFAVKSGADPKPYGPTRRLARGRPTRIADLARPQQDPKVVFQKHGGVQLHDYRHSRAEVLKDFHIFSTQNPASAMCTKTAQVPNDWVYLHDRQCLKVRYCRGMLSGTPTVDGGVREIYRDLPPAKPLFLSFNQNIRGGEKREFTGLVTKYYNALPPNSPYRRAHVTRVAEGWRPGGGDTDEVRDHVKFTSHAASSLRGSTTNMIGESHTIRRPLTVSFGDEVEQGSRGLIEQKVREQHETLDPSDKAKPSNVALVVGGSYKNTQGKDEAQVGYYEFPDCPQSQVEQYKDHGRRPVALE